MIYSGIFTAFVNNKSTNIQFSGKFNESKRVIRFTQKHYNKKRAEALNVAFDNNFLTKENYNEGFYDFHVEDENHVQYKFDYHASGLSNNLDNGYFYRKVN